MFFRQIATEVKENFWVSISYKTILAAAEHPGKAPLQRGPAQLYLAAAKLKLVMFIEELRLIKLLIFKNVIMSYANKLIAGTIYEANYPEGVTDNWYACFCSSHKDRLQLENQTPLELNREKWVMSKNIGKHYNVVKEKFLDQGFAVKNPEYDPTIPVTSANQDDTRTHELFWKEEKHGRVFSYDETKFKLSIKKMGQINSEKMVLVGPDDKGESLVNKSFTDATLVGESFMDTRALPCLYVFKGVSYNRVVDTKNPPVSHVLDTSVDPLHYLLDFFDANKSSGMTNDMGVLYMEKVIL